jgi:hypothetical protein
VVRPLESRIALVMDTDPHIKKSGTDASITALLEEGNAINFANQLYWKREGHSPEAAAEYQLRQERLEEITRAIAAARSTSGN